MRTMNIRVARSAGHLSLVAIIGYLSNLKRRFDVNKIAFPLDVDDGQFAIASF